MSPLKVWVQKIFSRVLQYVAAHHYSRSDFLQARSYIEALLANARNQEALRITRFGTKAFSQNDEDGLIEEIFRRIGTASKTFIEFGCGDGLENNTILLLYKGWRGLWMDGGEDNERLIRYKYRDLLSGGQLKFQRCFITAESIDGQIAQAGFKGEIDLLSVDLDGNDLHIFNAIQCVQPRVVIIEYNGKFPPSVNWSMKYNPKHVWDGSDYFGASLKAMEKGFAERGYSLVGCNLTGANAFFVRSDLVRDKFAAPFSAENHYEEPRYFLTGLFSEGHKPSRREFY